MKLTISTMIAHDQLCIGLIIETNVSAV